MTTVIKNRRTKQEQRPNWFGLCLARRRKTKDNRRTFLSPRKRGKRRGLRAETKLVWSLLSFARYFGIIQINLASALAVPSFQILNGLYFVCFAATKIQNYSRFLLYFAIFFILNSSFYHTPSKGVYSNLKVYHP